MNRSGRREAAGVPPPAALGTIDVRALLAWYGRHGRSQLPWRVTRDPYRVLVSEFMLQQTQVGRVVPLYLAFLAAFPTIEMLAAAAAGEVVRAWRGLGYNARALRLHALARTVRDAHGGRLPHDREALLALPGVGPYTAAALRAFAFDLDDVAFDTNLRRIVHRTAFGLELPRRATERQLDTLATAQLPPGRGHDFNSALMDVGATLCTARTALCLVCPLAGACAAAPVDRAELARRVRGERAPAAVPFERSTRFLRGRIIDRLREERSGEGLALATLATALAGIVPDERLGDLPATVATLVREGIVVWRGDAVGLP